ncbi:MAG: TPM domain-containing protein [Chitinophagales bacterium]|jgi:uncharacterized protein|nr:TPM domain-containing protein [Chitinophagales bacterium]
MKFPLHKAIKLGVVIVQICFSSNLWAQANKSVNFGEVLAKPNTPSLLIDEADLLNAEEENKLLEFLHVYQDSTSNELLVLTVKSLNGLRPYEYATQIGVNWAVGDKEKDNGIVFLIAPNERKAFIATGYGLQSRLTDYQAKEILDQLVMPYFKKSQYFQGIANGIIAITAQIQGEYIQDKPIDESSGQGIPFWLIIIIILLVYFWSKKSRFNPYHTTIGRGLMGGSHSPWFDMNSSGGSSRGGFDFGGGDFGGSGAESSW